MKRFWICLMLLPTLLVGCFAEAPASTTLPVFTEEPEAVLPEEQEKMMEVYRLALTEFLEKKTYPDGTVAEYSADYGSMEENSFAIEDVDGDGEEELLIRFTTSDTADMAERVYGYDRQTGTLHRELWEFVAVDYYDNGTVKAEVGLNHSLDSDFMPYYVYEWEPLMDVYLAEVAVSAWNKAEHRMNYMGDYFPEDVAKGDDRVYCIDKDGYTMYLNEADYVQWETEVLGGAKMLLLSWQSLTAENIRAAK